MGRLEGKLGVVLPVCRIPHVSEGDKLVHVFLRFRPHIFSGKSVVVDVEGVAFQPRAVVLWRGVMAGCVRISSQNYGHEKLPLGGYMQ